MNNIQNCDSYITINCALINACRYCIRKLSDYILTRTKNHGIITMQDGSWRDRMDVMDSIHLARDMNHWKILVNTVMNLRVP
jgi:hypothetical protein